MLKFSISSYAACFVGKVCCPLCWTSGAPLGEDQSGVEVGIINREVARRARCGQPPPPPKLKVKKCILAQVVHKMQVLLSALHAVLAEGMLESDCPIGVVQLCRVEELGNL